jgi:hypothetical protein
VLGAGDGQHPNGSRVVGAAGMQHSMEEHA